MPFFGSKFFPKKSPLRKSTSNINEAVEDLFDEKNQISLKIGAQECVFQDGDWVPENGLNGSLHKNTQRLKNKIQQLEEENYMLKLKYELLLNMLTETTAESHVQQREIEKMQHTDKKKRYK